MLLKLSFLKPLILIFFSVFLLNKAYHKSYYENGKIKEQGWKKGDSKEDFWKFYYSNGKIKEQGHYKGNKRTGYWYFYSQYGKLQTEGHYTQGSMVKWWLFYDKNEKVIHKCQLQNGIKNGYCLKYMNEELTSAEKYKNGKKIKEWFSFRSFKKENKLSDLK